MKAKNGHWISTTLLFLSVLVLMAVFISIISLSITQDAYAVGGLPYIGSPTPPPVGTPAAPIVLPHTIELVEDIWEGDRSGYPRYFISYLNDLIFRAYDPIANEELFEYDGNMTSMVADLEPDGSSAPNNFIVYGDKLYFVASGRDASDNPIGRELFSYDGSTASLVADILPGEEGSSPHLFVVHNGELYFIADGLDAENTPVGEELFKYDGSTVTLVKDFNPGESPGGEDIYSILSYGNTLYFYMGGSDDATFKLVDNEMVFVSETRLHGGGIEFQGAWYFAGTGKDALGNEVGTELFRLDNDEIELVADIKPGYWTSYGTRYYYSSSPEDFTILDNKLYFTDKNNIYIYDGSTISKLLDDFPWQGHPAMVDDSIWIYELVGNDDALYFSGDYYNMFENAMYWGLYRFDGERVEFMDTFRTDMPYLAIHQNDLFLSIDDGSGIGRELWMLDTDPGRITTTTVTLDHPAALPGEPVEVHVTVTAGDGALLNETIDVGDGIGNNCQATLVNGIGSCSLTFNETGDYTIYARYPWGNYYFSSSHEADLNVVADYTPPTGAFTSPLSNGAIGIPRGLMIVEADDLESGIQSVEFQAYYDGGWHTLNTDTDPSDGWRYQWGTYSLSEASINLRAILMNGLGETTTIQVDNISLSSAVSIGGTYESRESSESPQNVPEEYLLPNLPYPYLVTPY